MLGTYDWTRRLPDDDRALYWVRFDLIMGGYERLNGDTVSYVWLRAMGAVINVVNGLRNDTGTPLDAKRREQAATIIKLALQRTPPEGPLEIREQTLGD